MTTTVKAAPDDYKDYVYRFTYFCLTGLAKRIPQKITPNQITLVSFFCAMFGTFLLVAVKSPMAYLYWVIFNFAWYILDALDGMHARLSGQGSEFGGFLDHALDDIYFLFMLTAFAYKFDLLHLFYVYILLLRVTCALSVFLVQAHTGRMYLSRFSGGVELILLTIAMILSYCYPHFDLTAHVTSHFWLSVASFLSLQKGVFIKIAFLPYLIGVPITIAQHFVFVKKHCA